MVQEEMAGQGAGVWREGSFGSRDVLEVGPGGPADEGVLWGPGEEEEWLPGSD